MRCLLCGLPARRHNCCEACLKGLPFLGKHCIYCALPHDNEENSCDFCTRHPPPWQRLHAALCYEFPVPRLIQDLKFNGRLASARLLASAMDCLPIPQANMVAVPVPLHWTRRLSRGYNQAEELLRHLGRARKLDHDTRGLRRIRRTRPQSGTRSADREENVRSAFAWRGPGPAPARILLVDDVMTTGATLRQCALCLVLAGAEHVEVVVAARVMPD